MMADKNKNRLGDAKPNALGLKTTGNGAQVTGVSVLQSLGGWLGILESMLPGTAFVTTYTLTKQMLTAIIVAAAISLGFIARQIIRRRSLTQAIAGAIGIAIAAYLPLRPGGEDADYFIPGFLTNTGYLLVLAISIVAKWPLIGVLVSLFRGSGFAWRKEPSAMRRFTAATGLWVVLFSLRLAIQLPIYFAGNIDLLALVKLAMGTPLYALTIWLTWLIIRSQFSKTTSVA